MALEPADSKLTGPPQAIFYWKAGMQKAQSGQVGQTSPLGEMGLGVYTSSSLGSEGSQASDKTSPGSQFWSICSFSLSLVRR